MFVNIRRQRVFHAERLLISRKQGGHARLTEGLQPTGVRKNFLKVSGMSSRLKIAVSERLGICKGKKIYAKKFWARRLKK